MTNLPVVTYGDAVEMWRCWRVTPDGVLRSMVVKAEWKPGWNVAQCRPLRPFVRQASEPGEPRPLCTGKAFIECGCGFWALESAEQVMAYPSFGAGHDRVLGTVRLAGRFVHGTGGWRAERARVWSLQPPTLVALQVRVRRAAERYDVAVVTSEEVPDGDRSADRDRRDLAARDPR